MILDHTLWIRITAQHPILHVAEVWAVERTHASAKTVAQAEVFVEEAFRLIHSLQQDPAFHETFSQHGQRIWSGLHIFAGKRYIDAGRPALALRHLWKAFRSTPFAVGRVWYKGVQALGGTLGLGGAFLAYRQARRKIQYGSKHLLVDEQGIHWV
jgi:hypothetical protein